MSAPQGGSSGGPEQHRSQAIGSSLERLLATERKVEILDLGAASGETLSFYAERPCKIFFGDFYPDLQAAALDPEEGSQAFTELCHQALPFDTGAHFDLVNSWDLFNYLTLEQVAALSRYLRPFCSDRAPLVSFIWNTQRIPAQPNRYAIIDHETVEYRPTSYSERPGPRYKEPVLLRAMPEYRAGRSFLLRHGIQEYIFEPRPAGASSPA